MLPPGSRLGPYEIVSPLGTGGMGEVYRARDTRLGREVAVKVLSGDFSRDADRLKRFELEARATGQLGHPNILAVFDIGATDAGAPYVVSELLEGETLRSRLARGAIPVRRAIELAIQLARGLAAAHDKGIVHRDLKPENVFVTGDGHLKILDFGLAKQLGGMGSGATATGDLGPGTDAGTVMGTVGYMSPEQVRGRAVDQRSDIFAFGVLLYEMLAGRRPFQGDSAVETLNAILNAEPPEIDVPGVPAIVERIARRCLEKEASERFRSAYDIALALEASQTATTHASGKTAAIVDAPRGRRGIALALLTVVALAAGGAIAERRWLRSSVEPPAYQQITFGHGVVFGGRFTADGNSIVYSAAWEGGPIRMFAVRPENGISAAVPCPDAQVLAISRAGELAIKLVPDNLRSWFAPGTLARLPLGGGTPRRVAEDVMDADWSPKDGGLAVVRAVPGHSRVEYPIGAVVYESTANAIQKLRFSPTGDRLAFGNGARIQVLENGQVRTVLETGWWTGLAWTPAGDEILFGLQRAAEGTALAAVSLSGKQRVLARVPGSLVLWDIATDGRVLLAHDRLSSGTSGALPGESRERNLTWLDTRARDLSEDGRAVVLQDSLRDDVYIRSTDAGDPVRLGSGTPYALSPDGKWLLTAPIPGTTVDHTAYELVLLPTGAGEPRHLAGNGLRYQSARWLPDAARLLVLGAQGDGPMRVYLQDVASARITALSPEGMKILGELLPTPDGSGVMTRTPEGLTVLPIAGTGAPRLLEGLGARDRVIRFSSDGAALFTYIPGELPVSIFRVELATHRRTPWRQITPADVAGLFDLAPVLLSGDGTGYAYSYRRNVGNLYLANLLR